MSAYEYHCPIDEELCEKEINKLLKIYRMETLPNHIREDISRVLDNIGWSCWFADWINHRIYCWVLEINASRSKPDCPDFIHWEYLPSERSSKSEEELDEESEEEDDECKDCGWRSEYPQSHILYCGGTGCVYIRSKYRTWFDEDGELKWEEKQVKTEVVVESDDEALVERLAEEDFNIKKGK